jgi:glycosyltransferase involved in cell wall biosynthesis
MNHNILYLSYDGMTDPLGQSQVLPYLAGLAKYGYKFSLISFEKPERFESQRETIQGICQENGIEWSPLIYTKNPPILSTIYDLVKLFTTIFRLHRTQKFKIIHCRSFVASMAGYAFKFVSGCKFIFDARGFWVDERVEGGIFKSRLLYKLLKRVEFAMARKADAVTLLTQAAIDDMKSWKQLAGIDAEKYHHITTCVDLEKFRPIFEERISQVFDENNLEFLYVGSIGPWHSFEKVSAFISSAYKNFPLSKFRLIIGFGKEYIENYLAENNFDQKRFEIKTVPHYLIHNEFKTADIGFFFIPPVYAKIASSPTKMGEMLAAGIPIITGDKIGDVDWLVKNNNIGRILVEANEKTLSQAITEVVEMLKTNQKNVSKRCLTVADDYFSLEKGVKKYADIYEKLING